MRYEVKGTTTPVLEVELGPGDEVIGEAGELIWMAGDVKVETTSSAGGATGGLFGAAKRAVSGGSFFMSRYEGGQGTGVVGFGAKAPGELRELDLDGTKEWVVHRHGLICFERGVALNVHLQKKLGAGIFGGAGLVLQRLSGNGKAWIEMHGDVIGYNLGPGDQLMANPGHLALFESSVTLEFATLPGIRNKLFAGDSLFFTRLIGPGQVWLQSISLAQLAAALEPYLARDTAEVGTAGAVIGGLLKNR